MEFIFKFSTPDALSSCACPCMRKNKHFSIKLKDNKQYW
jgi:hypothetical protein